MDLLTGIIHYTIEGGWCQSDTTCRKGNNPDADCSQNGDADCVTSIQPHVDDQLWIHFTDEDGNLTTYNESSNQITVTKSGTSWTVQIQNASPGNYNFKLQSVNIGHNHLLVSYPTYSFDWDGSSPAVIPATYHFEYSQESGCYDDSMCWYKEADGPVYCACNYNPEANYDDCNDPYNCNYPDVYNMPSEGTCLYPLQPDTEYETNCDCSDNIFDCSFNYSDVSNQRPRNLACGGDWVRSCVMLLLLVGKFGKDMVMQIRM